MSQLHIGSNSREPKKPLNCWWQKIIKNQQFLHKLEKNIEKIQWQPQIL